MIPADPQNALPTLFRRCFWDGPVKPWEVKGLARGRHWIKGGWGVSPGCCRGSLKCSTEVREPVQLADPTIGIVS